MPTLIIANNFSTFLPGNRKTKNLQKEITEKAKKGDFSNPEVVLIGESELQRMKVH